ncbi:hypothetical protein QSJ18_18405 [Gordonia sp. ABSL1-1]|uniref:hypothetical protein n=1 Tax=Gordonia sp. ABSL1-1 TaxID=3053923 RepID=UPI002573EBD0|nr:hypothetical protein [Gordonia sp. ABSL1-1]MDL9938723.1 hypothetical protein [Gordonia sp. ABSL1-1]
MPVLDRLIAKRHTMSADLQEEVDTAWGAVKVRADSASDMYWQTPKEVWNRESDFPPIRLPFPSIWMEWSQPDAWLTDGNRLVHRQDTEIGVHRAVLLREAPGGDNQYFKIGDRVLPVRRPKGTAHTFTISCHMLREGKACFFPFVGVVHVDEAGVQLQETRWAGPSDDPRTRDTVDLLHVQFGKPALLAVGLMNCKNVELGEHESSVPIGRRQRRRNRGIAYRTIDIPGHARGVSSATGESGRMSLHRVRGHFKTFTADAPLLGQHVGTYWWGWQVRGKQKNGVNVTDYRIGGVA